METGSIVGSVDFNSRLRRSRGRTGRTFVASAKVTRTEQNELEAAAEAEGKALSEWAREAMLREARRSKDDALFTEVVAVRMLLLNLMKPLAQGQKLTPENIVEIMAVVKKEKHKAAKEVMQQYAGQPSEGR